MLETLGVRRTARAFTAPASNTELIQRWYFEYPPREYIDPSVVAAEKKGAKLVSAGVALAHIKKRAYRIGAGCEK